MSSATPSPLPDKDYAVYLRDMLDFCEQVIAYTAPVDLTGLLADRMRFDATLRNLELIGIAAQKVPEEMRALAPTIAWREIVGLRNRVAHTYLGLDGPTLWRVVADAVPKLRLDLIALLARLDAAPPRDPPPA
jgi:uncharacterized protein with HEPN domain